MVNCGLNLSLNMRDNNNNIDSSSSSCVSFSCILMNSLVQYESSDDDDDKSLVSVGSKRKTVNAKDSEKDMQSKMPKLPSFFDKTVPTQPEDKKKDHKGRVRTVPHTPDSWATYVYCKVNLASEMEPLLPYLKAVEMLEEQHISLSRPVYLKKYQLDSFASAVKAALENANTFKLSFAQLAHLTNDEKTRSFLTLEVGSGYNELFSCMTCVDKVMRQYHKPTFYDPPRFHTSIAWSLKSENITSIDIPPEILEPLTTEEFTITKVYVKMGNQLRAIVLSSVSK